MSNRSNEMMKKGFLVLCILCLGSNVFAQDLTFVGSRWASILKGRIGKSPWLYDVFMSSTFDNFRTTIAGQEYPPMNMNIYFEPKLLYQMSSKLTVGGGLIYQRNNPFLPNYVNEVRPFEQLTLTTPLSKISKFTHRFRFEERFVENRALDIYQFATRCRYSLGYNKTFRDMNEKPSRWYMSVSDEAYFSLTGNKNATFSEDWFYAGIGNQVSKKLKLEMGYMQQWQVRNIQHDIRNLYLLHTTAIVEL